MTVVVPLLFHCFTPQNRAEKGYSIRFCFVACKAIFPDDCNPRTKQSAWIVFGSERRRAWVRFLVKHTRRNNWTTGQISTIPTTKLIRRMPIIMRIGRIRIAGLISRLIMPTATISRVKRALFDNDTYGYTLVLDKLLGGENK